MLFHSLWFKHDEVISIVNYRIIKFKPSLIRVHLCVFQAFVDACVKYNNKYEAKKYVTRVTPDKKVSCFLKIG